MASNRINFLERPIFKENSSCPVAVCQTLNTEKNFATLAQFNKHWTRFHMPFFIHMECMRCKSRSKAKPEARRHYRYMAGHGKLQHLSKEVKVVNPFYRPPGDVLKPRAAIPAEREAAKEERRQAEKEQRHRLKEKTELSMNLELTHEMEDLDYLDDIVLDN